MNNLNAPTATAAVNTHNNVEEALCSVQKDIAERIHKAGYCSHNLGIQLACRHGLLITWDCDKQQFAFGVRMTVRHLQSGTQCTTVYPYKLGEHYPATQEEIDNAVNAGWKRCWKLLFNLDESQTENPSSFDDEEALL